MTDYDLKSIPVLDDVIENGDDEKKDFDLSIGSVESPETDADSELAENNLDLFSSEGLYKTENHTDDSETPAIIPDPVAINGTAATGTADHDTKPQIDEISNLHNEEDSWVTQNAIAEQQSGGMPDSHETADGENTVQFQSVQQADDEADKFESALIDYNNNDGAETPVIDVAKQQHETTDTLQTLSDDIVKQLMPEMEQLLRRLLKQALQEKLPNTDSRDTVSPSTPTDSD